MKKTILIFILFATITHSFGQTKTFTVDYNTNNGTYKSLGSVNCGAIKSVAGYTDIGINEVRTHDYYGPTDYWHYTTGFVNHAKSAEESATYNSSFDPQLPSSYKFTEGSDATITNLVDNGFQPYFRLGVSYPATSCPYTPISPPIDSNNRTFHIFASICKKTVEHYTDGWNKGFNYTIPYWEVWNEPDGVFWSGSPSKFFQLYKEVADSIKAFNPNLKVGTCGAVVVTIINHKTTYFDDLIRYCKTNSVPLDFYSWHLYGRFNPYSIKNFSDTVRSVLDSNGFEKAESHITEINAELDPNSIYDRTAKGSAYVARILMTCQESFVDKIFWYRGEGLGPLANPDISGEADLTWNGYGMKAHNTLVAETPIKISSTGNEVINFNSSSDTTNLMIIAGKNSSGTQTDILVSNLKTSYTSLSVNVNNLPYTFTDVIKVEQFTTKGPNTRYELSSDTVSGSSSLILNVASATAPSVYLFKITKIEETGINELGYENKIYIFPNPSNRIITFSEILDNIEVYNVFGQLVMSNIKFAKSISTLELSDGIYFIHSNNANLKFIVKH